MATQIPSAVDLKDKLSSLGHKEVQELAKLSSVPFTTLWKVKDGTTSNPGVETVRKFWPHLLRMARKAAAA